MQDEHFDDTGFDNADSLEEEGSGRNEDASSVQPARLSIRKKDEVIQEFVIESLPVTIGRKAENGIVLEDRNVSRKHAEIVKENDQFFLRDSGSTGGTRLNGQPVVEKDIHTGDVIQIGEYRLTFDSGDPDDERTVFDDEETRLEEGTALDEDRTRFYEEPEARLLIIKSDILDEDVVLGDQVLVLGRDEEADVNLDDKRASRKHCEVRSDGSEFIIRDLGSANGTFVNGQKVSEQPLKNGDRIQIGSTVLEFRMDPVHKPKHRSRLSGVFKGVFYLFLLAAVSYGAYRLITGLSGRAGGPVIMQTLWTYATRDAVQGSPALGDVNGDGFINLIAADAAGFLYGLDARHGGMIWNSDFNTRAGSMAGSTKLADINLIDGELDVVAGTASRGVLALDGGTMRPIWWGKTESQVLSSPAVADINSDGIPDVVVGTLSGRIICFDGRQGGVIWSFEADGPVTASPVMVDINGDAVPDVIVGSTRNRLYALDGRNGQIIWVHSGTEAPSTAAVADFNGDKKPDVVFVTASAVIVLEGTRGALLWRWEIPESARPTPSNPFLPLPPALADLNRDRIPEIIFSTPGGHVFALDTRSGTQGYLWDFSIGPSRKTSPALFDFNGDGISDVAVGDDQGILIIINGVNGHQLNTLAVGSAVMSSPVIGDFTGSGTACLAVGTMDRKIVAVQTQSRISRGKSAWPFFGGDIRNTGFSR
ncbi:MAG TPA: FHA domain-containing protein [bacterium]|nr:FHA domain-containing protein [bacterium]